MKTLILTPLAERDIHFYLATAKELKKDPQIQIVFLSFFQPGNDLLRQSGFPVFDPYIIPAQDSKFVPLQQLEQTYDTPSLESLIRHDQLTFGISDSEVLLKKFRTRLSVCEFLLEQIEKQFPSSQRILVQELAGFISPLSLFLVARKRGWKHFFTEPCFFKGRIHFLLNDLYLHISDQTPSDQSRSSVSQYLQEALNTKLVVAASKDAHHYRDMGFTKVFNWTNLQKILKKNYQKYLRGQRQEFEFFWNHSRRYLIMLFNRYQNSSAYVTLQDLPRNKKFVYFPFHVQLDFSLTIRSPDWLDQLSLIEKALDHLPPDLILLTKEHPASIGCLDQKRLKKVLAHPQFRLMHPQINSYDILDRCIGVITINSKVGAEALTKGLPAFTFGTAFYTQRGFAEHFKNWSHFRETITQWTQSDSSQPKVVKPAWLHFLAQVWEESSPTELYDLTPQNIQNFTRALLSLFEKAPKSSGS